jgi:ABC-type phosphate transport system permease subunit
MKLNVKALALTTGLLWGGAMFVTGLANLIWSTYAVKFLEVIASVYPGYHANGTFIDLIVGTLYALIDGAVVGLIFGWLYNVLLTKKELPAA